MYKSLRLLAPQTRNAKNPLLNRPSKYKHPRGGGGLFLGIALKYKVKESKNGKFPPNYTAGPIDFEMQIWRAYTRFPAYNAESTYLL